MNSHEACENCKFFHDGNGYGEAVCRRHAPVPVAEKHNYRTSDGWVKVFRRDWCGDYERKV